MRSILSVTSGLFRKIMFDNSVRFAVFRCIAMLVLAVLVVSNPFIAASWFRWFIIVFCSGFLLMVLSAFRLKKKTSLLFASVFLLGMIAFYFGRGDAVSGIGIAGMCCCTGIALLIPGCRVDRYDMAIRVFCALAAFAVTFAVIIRNGQLGVRYLDQLHAYALALAGCGFANLFLMKKEYI